MNTVPYRLGTGLIICLIAFQACVPKNQVDHAVHIAVETQEPLPEGDTMFLTGNIPELGSWNGRGIAMIRVQPNRWEAHFSPKDSAFAYKLTLGDWSQEAELEEGMAYRDLGGWHGLDTLLHAIKFGAAQRHNDGQVSGFLHVMDAPVDPEGIIPSRKMWVWTPYDLKQTELAGPLDLLIMSDGQNCIDPATSTFGVDWAVDEAILSLMEAGQIRPTMVVALECATEGGNRRRMEYGPGELGESFTDYLVHTVLAQALEDPYLTEESHVYFAGSSMGGVLAFRLLTEYPGVFDGALAFSPAVYVETSTGLAVDAISPWKVKGRPMPSGTLYMDNGGIGLDAQLQPGIDLLKAELRSIGFMDQKDSFKWVVDKKADHSEVAWRQRFPEAFAWLSSRSSVSEE
ncbi:MAG: alpha/beta hydrolase-fold protein [Schleiferiaceae bacterium]|nr:alpha/beta hydrolase-fold protein [Schleiferiaceae bacterium]